MEAALKLALYAVGGIVATLFGVVLITRGQGLDSNSPLLLPIFALFTIQPLGAFWMMYIAIRYEKNPFPLILLAMFIPFSFLWYYFERVRPGKVRRVRNFA